jgi:uncharacterized protein with PQ loop repeat
MAKRHRHHLTHHKQKIKANPVDKVVYVAAFAEPASANPQVLAIYTAKTAAGISLFTWSAYLTFSLIWLWYGIVHKQKALIIASVLFAVSEVLVIIGGILYGAGL